MSGLVIKLFQLLDLHDTAGQVMVYSVDGIGLLYGRISVPAMLVWDCSALKKAFLNGDEGMRQGR